MTFLLATQDLPSQIEEEFPDVLVQPPEGYYRSGDLQPFLPYRNKAGLPMTYYVEGNGMDRRPVDNLALVRGVIYNEDGERVTRIYKVGDIQLSPQRPVIGLRLIEAYIHAVIDTSRAWSDSQEINRMKLLLEGTRENLKTNFMEEYNINIATNDPKVQAVRDQMDRLSRNISDRQIYGYKDINLYHRFINFLKPEFQDNFNRSLMHEDPMFSKEETHEYVTKRRVIPYQEHPLHPLLLTVIRYGHMVIEPLARFIHENPWLEFSVEIHRGDDFAIRSLGDHRINQWHFDRCEVKSL